MRQTGREAIAWCADQQAHPTVDWTFHCLAMVGAAWAIDPVGGGGAWPNAWDAWTRSTQHSIDPPPPGAPVYWELYARGSDGVRRNYGHIAVADVFDGLCWSIDIRRHGCVDLVPLNEIARQWDGRYVGWSSDLEGVPLPLGHSPVPDPPPAPPVGDNDMPTPCGFIVCNAGTLGHHVDGSGYACPVDGTVFRVNPGGTIQWVHAGEQEDTTAVMAAAGLRTDTWNGAVASPDVFGRLVGDKPY
jgi:hypothetical protein